jgi:predicted enzyme related to lactoylglutathione lyase
MPAFDIGDHGRMAVCFDPNGAQFDVWQPKKGPGTDVDTSLHGAPSWFETLTTDVDRARTFYCALFGWTAEAMPLPDMQYTTFRLGDGFVAGLMQITPEMGKIKPHWGTYFTVKDVEQAAREAVKLGGALCVPPRDVPGVGRFAGVVSPQGVMFYVIQYIR